MKIIIALFFIRYGRGVEMSRLWLNNDFGPVETISESIMIYHVVLSGDTCNMRRSPDLKSLRPAKKGGFDSTDHFKILFDLSL
jgi:hypothetical protein